MYLDTEDWANGADLDEMLHNAASPVSTLSATHPAIFRQNIW